MIVPLGINADENKTITISSESVHRPSTREVYLEDKELNIFTNLNVKNYTFTTNESLNGIGRFFMHTTSQVLDIDDTLLAENISIYKTNLRIVGIQNGTADLVLFDIL